MDFPNDLRFTSFFKQCSVVQCGVDYKGRDYYDDREAQYSALKTEMGKKYDQIF